MKNKLKKLLYPKDIFVILSIFVIILSLTYLITCSKFGTPLSYILYLLMTYSLIIISLKTYKTLKEKLNVIIDNNKFLRNYKNNDILRYKISLSISFIFNILYALFKLVIGIIFKSIWFISFAFYYTLLASLKFNIIKEELKHKTSLKDEYLKYRNTAVTLLFTNIILTMIILVIVNKKIMNIYPDWLAISIAVYTFYLVFISVYNFIKYRKYKSPLIYSSKIINVINSLISLISLEIVLIPTFGKTDIQFFEIMIMATGGGVAVIISIISLYMIIKATEWLKDNEG